MNKMLKKLFCIPALISIISWPLLAVSQQEDASDKYQPSVDKLNVDDFETKPGKGKSQVKKVPQKRKQGTAGPETNTADSSSAETKKFGSTVKDVVGWLTRTLEGYKTPKVSTTHEGKVVWELYDIQDSFRLEGQTRIRHTQTHIHKFSDGEILNYKYTFLYDISEIDSSKIIVNQQPPFADSGGSRWYYSLQLWYILGFKSIHAECLCNNNPLTVKHDQGGLFSFESKAAAEDIAKAMKHAIALAKAKRY